MQISFQTILKGLESPKPDNLLPGEVVTTGAEDHERYWALLDKATAENRNFLEVKLLIDGQEFEPKLLQRLLEDQAILIQAEAKSILANRLRELEDTFQEKFEGAVGQFKEKFGLERE
jgi:hypothetical protein